MILFFALIFALKSAHSFDLILKACDEYAAFTQLPYFVDKTTMLSTMFREKIEAHKTNMRRLDALFFQHIITVPSGFGKTTNLKMVKAFAQVELDHQFRPKPKNQTKAYEIFKSLRIAAVEQAMDIAMNEFYVLSIDLEFSPEELADETVALDTLRNKIRKLYQEYEFIRPRLRNNDTELTPELFNKTLYGNLEKYEIKDSIINLVYALRRDVGIREVVFLVDNFDSLIWYLIKNPKYYFKWLDELIKEMILELTYRRMRVKQSIFFGVTNFNFYDPQDARTRHFLYYSFLNNGRFQNFFGFTPFECYSLLQNYNCTEKEKVRFEKYYKPLKTAHGTCSIYNPVSTVGYLQSKNNGTGNFEPYWGRNQSIDFFADFAKAPIFGEKLKTFIIRGSMKYDSYIRYHLPSIFIRFLESPERNYQNLHEDDVGDLFIFLHECGFVSADDKKGKDSKDSNVYKLPNTEIAETLKQILVKVR